VLDCIVRLLSEYAKSIENGRYYLLRTLFENLKG
jgi:hypothetical protein